MRSRFTRVLASAVVLTALAARPAAAAPFSNLFIFGDSLSDTGNLSQSTGGLLPGGAPYDGGRYSNGSLWVEHLAEGLGLAADAVHALAGGNNYAFAGARTGAAGLPPGVLAQAVGLFGPTHASADPDALYVIAGGGNDMRDARDDFGGTTPADILGRQLAAQTAVSNLQQTVGFLAARGARHFLIANLPDLGLTPEAAALNRQAASSDASARFNALMSGLVAGALGSGLDVRFLDLVALNQAIIADALTNGGALYGITNVVVPCAGFAGAAPYNLPCSASLFSDGLHPSARAHELMGQAALRAVPEPAVLALFTLGTLAAVRRRRA